MKISANLLSSATADGSGDSISWQGSKDTVIDLSGTVDGATVTIYMDIGNGFNTNLSELTMTATGLYDFAPVPADAVLKATVSGAGATTSLSCLMVNA